MEENNNLEMTPATAPAPEPAPASAPVATSAPVAEEAKAAVAAVAENKIKKGKYTEYTEHDLLVELITYQKKEAKRSGVIAFAMVAIALVFAACAAIVVPEIVDTLNVAQTTMEEANSLIGQIDTSLDNVNNVISDVDTMIEDNTEALEEAISKIGDIDIDGLNESISDLNKVVSSLGKFFGQ